PAPIRAPGPTGDTRAAVALVASGGRPAAGATGTTPASTASSDRTTPAATPAALTDTGSAAPNGPGEPVRRAVEPVVTRPAPWMAPEGSATASPGSATAPARTSFSGLPVGLTSITGRRAVRRLAAGSVGARGLSVRAGAHALQAASTSPSGSDRK